MKYCFFILLFVILGSCKTKSGKKANPQQEYAKWEMMYNTSRIFDNYIKIYDSIKPKFIQIEKENKTTLDSQSVDIINIDWNLWKQEMQKVNLYNKKYDNVYDMNQFATAEDGKLTTNITATNSQLPVRKMMINTQLANNDLLMLFAEYNDNGTQKKLMYVPHKSIQLIETKGSTVKIKQLDIVL